VGDDMGRETATGPSSFQSAELRRAEAAFGYRALGPLASAQIPSLMDAMTNAPSPEVRLAAEEVPIPLSGKPLVYRAQGTNWLLYSVGPDVVDDGGKPAEGRLAGKGDLFFESP